VKTARDLRASGSELAPSGSAAADCRSNCARKRRAGCGPSRPSPGPRPGGSADRLKIQRRRRMPTLVRSLDRESAMDESPAIARIKPRFPATPAGAQPEAAGGSWTADGDQSSGARGNSKSEVCRDFPWGPINNGETHVAGFRQPESAEARRESFSPSGAKAPGLLGASIVRAKARTLRD